MPDRKHILVFYEGDDDKVVLEGLQRMTLLPQGCEISQRDKQHHPGKDGLVRQLMPFIRPVNGIGGSAVVLVDLDELSRDQLREWFRGQLHDSIKASDLPFALEEKQVDSGRVNAFLLKADNRAGRVVLIPVGLAEDDGQRTMYGIDRFAIDDYILRLVREQRVYSAVSELEDVPHDLAMRKMTEVAGVLRQNSIAIHHAKRFLHILRAVAAVRPSSATFIERLMKKARETLSLDELRALFHPLVEDLQNAAQFLAPKQAGEDKSASQPS